MKPHRRRFLAALLAAPARAAAAGFRLAISNGTFVGAGFAEGCRIARRAGFTGLEVAPYTLADDPASLPAAKRRQLRRILADEGLEFVGLHAVLQTPKGLHLTTSGAALRQRSWEYFQRMIDLCGDLGAGSVLVLGSARQRAAASPAEVPDAVARLVEGLRACAPRAQAARVKVLMEPLAPHLCDVVTTLAEAMSVVRRVNSPAIATIFDTHNTAAENESPRELVLRYREYLAHVHLNEMDGRHPGAGDYDFRPLFRALREIRYQGWVSVEVFDFAPGGRTIAEESYRYLRRVEAELG